MKQRNNPPIDADFVILKPCPFCGADAARLIIRTTGSFFVVCGDDQSGCGARLTHSYLRVGGLSHDLPPDFDAKLRALWQRHPWKES